MASVVDCEKPGVWDTRLSYTKPSYTVRHGALNVSSQNFTALSQATSQHVYNVQVPSLQTYLDRFVLWTSTVQFEFTASAALAAPASSTLYPTGVALSGIDFALASYPLHRLTSSMLLSINDISTQLNTAQVLPTLLRLLDDSTGRAVTTTPSKLDVFMDATTGCGSNINPFGAFNQAVYDDVPNGAFPLQYLTPSGVGPAWLGPTSFSAYLTSNPTFAILGWAPNAGYLTQLTAPNAVIAPGSYGWYIDTESASLYTNAGVVGAFTVVINGIPYGTGRVVVSSGTAYSLATATTAASAVVQKVAVQYNLTENLLISPFVSGAPAATLEQAMFGINNVQLTCQMRDPASAKIVRQLSNAKAISAIKFINNNATTYQNSALITQFLTPPVALHIPARSIVPYHEIVAYPFTGSGEIAPGTTQILTSNVITLSQIPDLMVVRVSPYTSSAAAPGSAGDPLGAKYGDVSFPISNANVTFDNASGLLSNVPMQRLWAMSVENGLNMPWLQWSDGTAGFPNGSVGGGVAVTTVPYGPDLASAGTSLAINGGLAHTSGGELALAFGKDITMFETLAPGVAGNFSYYMQLTVYNPFPVPIKPQFTLMAVNSGFFTSVGGQSSRTTTPISQTEVLASSQLHKATEGMQLTAADLKRTIGSGAYPGTLGTSSMQTGHMGKFGSGGTGGAAVGSKRPRGTGGPPYAVSGGSDLEARFA